MPPIWLSFLTWLLFHHSGRHSAQFTAVFGGKPGSSGNRGNEIRVYFDSTLMTDYKGTPLPPGPNEIIELRAVFAPKY